ncbi:hypothetical protein KSP40_PGU013091 [Platanthera guangdongensis]|uniref:Uncharacterized protein n=1 Tax=Platanthera guangdongensis TaxID=2320717 RepID=A0ABR2MYM6_9ASPA
MEWEHHNCWPDGRTRPEGTGTGQGGIFLKATSYAGTEGSDWRGTSGRSTTRDHPIHLWDAVSGELRGTYRAYDGMDEITAALSVSFNTSGTKMLAVGSYSQSTAVFVEDNMELLYVLHGQMGGVTQVQFSKDGNYIYTGGRKALVEGSTEVEEASSLLEESHLWSFPMSLAHRCLYYGTLPPCFFVAAVVE